MGFQQPGQARLEDDAREGQLAGQHPGNRPQAELPQLRFTAGEIADGKGGGVRRGADVPLVQQSETRRTYE
jgi:hypothetical protein